MKRRPASAAAAAPEPALADILHLPLPDPPVETPNAGDPLGVHRDGFIDQFGSDVAYVALKAVTKKGGAFLGQWDPFYVVNIPRPLRRRYPDRYPRAQKSFGRSKEMAETFAGDLARERAHGIPAPQTFREIVAMCAHAMGRRTRRKTPGARKAKKKPLTPEGAAQYTRFGGLFSQAPWVGADAPEGRDGSTAGEPHPSKEAEGDAVNLGDLHPSKHTEDDAIEWVWWMAGEGVARKTQEGAIIMVRAIFAWAIAKGYCAKGATNPITADVTPVDPKLLDLSPPDDLTVCNMAQVALVTKFSQTRLLELFGTGKYRRSGKPRPQLIPAIKQACKWWVYVPTTLVETKILSTPDPRLARSRYIGDFISLDEWDYAQSVGLHDEPELIALALTAWMPLAARRGEWKGLLTMDIQVFSGTRPRSKFAGCVTIYQQVSGPLSTYRDTKNLRRRTVYVSATTLDALLALKARAERLRAAHSGTWGSRREELPLLVREDGGIVNTQEIADGFSRVLLRAGFEWRRSIVLSQLHKLRHLGGSIFWEESGHSDKITSRLLGVTEGVARSVYIHALDGAELDAAAAAADRIDNAGAYRRLSQSGDLAVLAALVVAARAASYGRDREAVARALVEGQLCAQRIADTCAGPIPTDVVASLRKAHETLLDAEAVAAGHLPGWGDVEL